MNKTWFWILGCSMYHDSGEKRGEANSFHTKHSTKKVFKVLRKRSHSQIADQENIEIADLDEVILKPKSEEHFYNLVRSSFKQRRKTLVNNLYVRYGEEKIDLISYLEDIDLNGKIRAENLSVSDFIKLSDYLLGKGLK